MTSDNLRFEPGDIVYDRADDADDRGEAVVLRYRRDTEGDIVPAFAVSVTAVGETVDKLNPTWDEEAPVVTVAFRGWLDEQLGDRWRDVEPHELWRFVRDFTDGWGIERQIYDYPEDRLEPANDDD